MRLTGDIRRLGVTKWLLLPLLYARCVAVVWAQGQATPTPQAPETPVVQEIEIPRQNATAVASTPNPSSQHVLNLQSAIERGINNYPGLQIARKATEIAQSQLREAKHTAFLPHFEATSLFGLVPDVPSGTGPPNFPNIDQNISADDGFFVRVDVEAIQPIYGFGRFTNLKRLAGAGVQASEHAERDEFHELVLNIKKVYFALAALNTIEDFLKEIDDKLAFVERRIDLMLASGKSEVTESDRLKVQIFRADLTNRRYETEENQSKLRYALSLLLGFGDRVEEWAVEKKALNKIEAEPFSLDSVMRAVRDRNPKLKQLEALVTARQSYLNITQANMTPIFFLGGEFKYAIAPDREDVKNPFLVDEFNDLTGGVALGLRQDLTFHLLRDRFHKARAEYEQALFQKRLAEDAILADAKTRVISADFTSKRLDVAVDGLRAARSWVGAELNNYEFGLTPTKDVLEAFIAYAKTKLDFIDATVKYNLAISALTRVTMHELFPIYYKGDGR